MNFEVTLLRVRKRVRLRNSKSVGRYDYGGILKQEKYNYNLDLPIFLLETLKADWLSES